MNLSETIVAAMIGAGATVATATFQLFVAFRSRKADAKPKRGSGLRSSLAVCALVLGAAVAGFGYSELRVHREREESRAMEQRISDRLQALANMQLAQLRNSNAEAAGLPAGASGTALPERSEAIARIAACRPQAPGNGGNAVGCDATNANRVALCASVPSQASVLEVQLFAHGGGESARWQASRVSADQDIDGARFTAGTDEIQLGPDQRAVCAQFLQWNSTHGHEARIVVVYTTGAVLPTTAKPIQANSGDGPERAVDADTGSSSENADASDDRAANPATPDIAAPGLALDPVQAVIAAQPIQ
jgi:hypothetical protein